MKKRKQVLMSSLVMLLVATLTLTSTTFAWFTTGSTGKVDQITFTADAASGIQISTDASSWKSSVSNTDIATAISTDYTGKADPQSGSMFTAETTKFTPVSTAGLIKAADGVMDMFSAGDGTNANTKKTETCGATTTAGKGSYYVFNLYINNISADEKTLTLTTGTVADPDTTKDAYKTMKDKDTSTAVRVGFIDQGNKAAIQEGKTADEVKAQVCALALTKGTADAPVKAVIYEPNATTHTTDATTYRGAKASTADTTYGVMAANDNLTVNDYGFIPGTDTTNVAATTTFTDVTKKDGSNLVATLKGNSITKLTIYIWIEGQDVDCGNDIAEGDVLVDMVFTATKKETTNPG